ncbi:hypothetical protein [Limnoglobus roseus]|uniref:Uncharacterized protein n=1 Tax=Limnoglobus roseus TaxID=2598579 RepID=A0A5C1AHU1_9BACT|nr:hypothetical protein [Limnoglobus roseus]QEL17222.1 hypothetical protein PX52LOC_04205 [Limnoglobus roseus]
MHIHTRYAVAFAGLMLASTLSPLSAQPQVPGGAGAGRPSFSPYLNLAGRGNNPGINYFGIVRPEQKLFQQTSQLQQQLSLTNQAVTNNTNSLNDNLFTGRGATFGFYSHYYYNSPTGGGGAGGGGSGFRTSGAGSSTGPNYNNAGAASVFRPGGMSNNIGQAPRPAFNGNPRR